MDDDRLPDSTVWAIEVWGWPTGWRPTVDKFKSSVMAREQALADHFEPEHEGAPVYGGWRIIPLR